MKAYITTLIRYKSHGWLYKVDLTTGKIEKRQQVFSNSQAAKHGGPHGLVWWGDFLITGTYSDIRIFDKELNEINRFSHPYLCGIHGVSIYKDRLWVSSCNNEGIFCFTPDGTLLEVHFLSENEKLMVLANKPVQIVDRQTDFRHQTAPYPQQPFHVNHVQETENALYLSLHKQGIIWDFRSNEMVLEAAASQMHDAQRIDDCFYLNDTGSHQLKVFTLECEIISQTPIPPWPTYVSKTTPRAVLYRLSNRLRRYQLFQSLQVCNVGWLRGLCAIDQDHILVGSSPAALLTINTKKQQVIRNIPLSTNFCEAVFGIVIDFS